MKVGLLFGLGVAALGACSSFDTASDGANGGTTDGGLLPDGAPAPVSGTSTGQVGIAFDVVPVIHGAKARVPFTITRGYNYSASVTVHAEGLPSTVTSGAVVVDAAATSGELVLDIGSDTPYGKLTGASIVATGSSLDAPSAKQPYEPEVRGAPGELDTSFGTGGALTIDNSDRGSEFDIDSSGRLLVLNKFGLRRFDANGKAEDTSFHPLQVSTSRPLLVARRGESIFVARNKPETDGVRQDGNLWKLDANGVPDPLYGANGIVMAGSNDHTVFQVDTDFRAISFTPTAGSLPQQFNYTPAGVYRYFAPSKAAHPLYARGVAFLKDHSAVFGGEHWVGKFLSDDQNIDTRFATAGYYTFDPSLHINDVISDANENVLIAGHLDSGALYLARLTGAGAADAAFHVYTSAVKVKTEAVLFDVDTPGPPITLTVPVAGRLSISASGAIYQAAQIDDNGTTRCAVLRHSSDGALDVTFGVDGKAIFAPGGCYAHRIMSQADGRVLVGGPVILRFWE